MSESILQLQRAVDIVNTSTHPSNRIAATIFHEKDGWSLSRVNYWPDIIDKTIGRDSRIGNSSGTIHAETACIFAAAFEEGRKCQGASITITDPPCPNCVKNMAEAGIDNIYIDHKGFHKDYAQRRIEYFQSLSVRLAEKAGMSIYEVNRKTNAIVPITIADKEYIPVNEKPIQFLTDEDLFISIEQADPQMKTAICYCDYEGNEAQIISISHPALGFDSVKNDYEITHPETKYSYIQEACNRLLMYAARHGLQIKHQKIYTSEVPTSRELVNMIGAGIKDIHVSHPQQARDNYALDAVQILRDHQIIIFNH